MYFVKMLVIFGFGNVFIIATLTIRHFRLTTIVNSNNNSLMVSFSNGDGRLLMLMDQLVENLVLVLVCIKKKPPLVRQSLFDGSS